MSDQFSPEYLTFLQGEGKVLQEYVEWKPGRWCLIDDELFVVTDVYGELPEPATLICYRVPGTRRLNITDSDVIWLATLFDLIQVIEGAGWPEKHGALQIIGPDWELPEWYVGDEEGVSYCTDKDIMLAAARLAVKAVEGKG